MASLAAAPHALRDDGAEAVRAIGVVAAAYAVMTLGDVAGKWALLPAGLAAVMIGRGLFGYLVFSELPGGSTLAGAAAVAAAGLYNLHRERVRRQEAVTA